jgi:BirA family biotin operon repressor/biotin-[acetyl-CoA-carboxylase] ligase
MILPDGLPIFFRPVALEAVDSTNDEAKRRAAAGVPEGTLVWAGVQTAGRGRRGRGWISPAGNLYMSVILRPPMPAGRAMQASFVAALAVAEAVAELLPDGCAIACKWPNDVLVGGRKTAGILLEASGVAADPVDWVVVGIGVNLLTRPADGAIESPATALAEEGGTAGSAEALAAVCRRFDAWHRTWRNSGFAPVRQAWLERAHGRGGPARVRLEGQMVEGVFVDLDGDGALVLQTEGRLRKIAAGDVFFGG